LQIHFPFFGISLLNDRDPIFFKGQTALIIMYNH